MRNVLISIDYCAKKFGDLFTVLILSETQKTSPNYNLYLCWRPIHGFLQRYIGLNDGFWAIFNYYGRLE